MQGTELFLHALPSKYPMYFRAFNAIVHTGLVDCGVGCFIHVKTQCNGRDHTS